MVRASPLSRADPAAVALQVHDLTGGNAYFVRALLCHLDGGRSTFGDLPDPECRGLPRRRTSRPSQPRVVERQIEPVRFGRWLVRIVSHSAHAQDPKPSG